MSLRAPRVRVLADGAPLPGVLEADVFANNHLAADRFRVRLAASVSDPAALAAPGSRLEVQASLGAGWASLILGVADSFSLDPIGGTLEVEGRDLAALLLDAPVAEAHVNRTASEIVAAVAARHGLGAAVTPTGATVGRESAAGRDRIALNQFARATSDWDLCAALAQQEGYDLFLSGGTLHFHPAATGAAVVLGPRDCLGLRLEQSLALSRGAEVTVRSWSARHGGSVAQSARSGGGATRHALVRPGLAPSDAQRMADRLLADITRHVRTASLTMPGELSLTPRGRVALRGVGAGFDGVYGISELTRHIDAERGFTQRLRLHAAEG